jgi:plasmid stabilization system protein ParE
MQAEHATYEVTVGEIESLLAYVAELAAPDEAEAAERLLGQLATLAQHPDGGGERVRFTPVPSGRALAARAMEALRSEGDVRMGSRRWRLQRSRPSRASNRRFAPGRSPGDGAS